MLLCSIVSVGEHSGHENNRHNVLRLATLIEEAIRSHLHAYGLPELPSLMGWEQKLVQTRVRLIRTATTSSQQQTVMSEAGSWRWHNSEFENQKMLA